MKRGDIFPDTAGHDDGWMVLDVGRREVVVIDMVFLVVWGWRMASDGIRVRQRRPTDIEWGEAEWVGAAITQHPPPDEVAAYLRRGS